MPPGNGSPSSSIFICRTWISPPSASGPESAAADAAIDELDTVIGKLENELNEAYDEELLWLAAGEYVINKVDHVVYPNRVLREAGLLAVRQQEDGEHLDFAASRAFAMADHQLSHIYLSDGSHETAVEVAKLFQGRPGIAKAPVGAQRSRYALDHPRSGEVILISTPDSWQAYYWWLADDRAPRFARTVDIHRKPGYDPVELFFDAASKSLPLDAALVKGSHGTRRWSARGGA